MPAQNSGFAIKDRHLFEVLRRSGEAGGQSAARFAHAATAWGRTAWWAPVDLSGSYDHLTRPALYEQARRIGIEGRSHMTKGELIDALRSR
jgi:hypothetical protein